MATLKIDNLEKRFGAVAVLRGMSLEIEDGALVSLLGPSGCGKSTLMRIVAGLESPSAGTVAIGDRNVVGMAPEKRNIALMFQSYALFPHMTVSDNVRFPLRMRNAGGRPEQTERATEALAMVQLESFADRFPGQLSGGQQQRVALARAIVSRPDVLMLDEPLSNLDARLREEMQMELIELHRRLRLTTLFVTHDQDEAMSLSDKVVLMREGRIEQEGPPDTLYDRPASAFAADFMGAANIFPATLSGSTLSLGDGALSFAVPADVAAIYCGGAAVLRQEDLVLTDVPEDWDVAVPAKIRTRVFLGGRARYRLTANGLDFLATVAKRDIAQADRGTHLAWRFDAIRFLPR